MLLCDAALNGPEILANHCVIENDNEEIILYPEQGALCTVNGEDVTEPTHLCQGMKSLRVTVCCLLFRLLLFFFFFYFSARKKKYKLAKLGIERSLG